MGYHSNEQTTKDAVKMAGKAINDRERYLYALTLLLPLAGLEPGPAIERIRAADFTELETRLHDLGYTKGEVDAEQT